MATSPVAVQTAPATKESAKNDTRLFDKLVKLWASHNERSLQVRQETGSLLNDRLGPPTKRQGRGRRVLAQAAQSLQIAESELNRMRWFAYLSKDEQSCWGNTPSDKRSWTQFKERLPSLIAAAKGSAGPRGSASDKKKVVATTGIFKLMDSASYQLRADARKVEGAEKEELIAKLRDLISAVSESTGIGLQLKEDAALAVA